MEGRPRTRASTIHPRTPPNSSAFTLRTPRNTDRRTQFSARPKQSLMDEAGSDSSDDPIEALQELIKKSWDIWAVSPLFQFCYDNEVKLKQYAKRLREIVAASLLQDNVSYEARFTPIPELTCESPDPPAMSVEVYSTNGQAETSEKRIYIGILLSWGAIRNPEHGTARLPMLLSRGLHNITQIVHSYLGQLFDCSITAMHATQEDLMWLATITLDPEEKIRQKKSMGNEQYLTLQYQIPGLPATDLILVKFPIASVSFLWKHIGPKRSSSNATEKNATGSPVVIEWEQVEKFHECIRRQMLNLAGLELGFCLLHKVTLPTFVIQSNKIKISNVETMDQILWFFQQKALCYTPLVVPMEED